MKTSSSRVRRGAPKRAGPIASYFARASPVAPAAAKSDEETEAAAAAAKCDEDKRAILNSVFARRNRQPKRVAEEVEEREPAAEEEEEDTGAVKRREESPGVRHSPRKHASTLERCVSIKENIKTPHRISLCENLDFVLPAVKPRSFQRKENQVERRLNLDGDDGDDKNHILLGNTNLEHKNGFVESLKKTENGKTVKKERNVKANGAVQNGNHKLTDYYPIRRSVRKTKKEVMEEKRLNIEIAIKKRTEEGLEVVSFEGKGRGIVASRKFERGEFVVEYAGELVDIAEAKVREARYAQDHAAGCYMYYFRHNDQHYCIDATPESGRLGRLVNHSRNGNLVTKSISIGSRPHLILLANQEISPGEEITYDYGDRSKESLQHHPWLAL